MLSWLRSRTLDPAIRGERVLPEILFTGFLALRREIVGDHFHLILVGAALFAHGPVAAEDEAVFAEAFPAMIEDRRVVGGFARGLAPFLRRLRGLLEECGYFAKDVLLFAGGSHAFSPRIGQLRGVACAAD